MFKVKHQNGVTHVTSSNHDSFSNRESIDPRSSVWMKVIDGNRFNTAIESIADIVRYHLDNCDSRDGLFANTSDGAYNFTIRFSYGKKMPKDGPSTNSKDKNSDQKNYMALGSTNTNSILMFCPKIEDSRWESVIGGDDDLPLISTIGDSVMRGDLHIAAFEECDFVYTHVDFVVMKHGKVFKDVLQVIADPSCLLRVLNSHYKGNKRDIVVLNLSSTGEIESVSQGNEDFFYKHKRTSDSNKSQPYSMPKIQTSLEVVLKLSLRLNKKTKPNQVPTNNKAYSGPTEQNPQPQKSIASSVEKPTQISTEDIQITIDGMECANTGQVGQAGICYKIISDPFGVVSRIEMMPWCPPGQLTNPLNPSQST